MVGEVHVCLHRAVGDLGWPHGSWSEGLCWGSPQHPVGKEAAPYSTQREGRQSYVRVNLPGWVCAFPGFAKKPLALPRLLSDLLLLL